MQRSYLVKSPVHFADFGFFVKVGDILMHDTANSNRLTVYRNGEAVRTVQQTVLGIQAFVKTGFIQEVVQPAHKAAPKAQPKQPSQETPKPAQKPQGEPRPLPKPQPKAKRDEEPKSYTAEEFTPAAKRGKAQGREVPADEMPDRLKQALALPKIEDETL